MINAPGFKSRHVDAIPKPSPALRPRCCPSRLDVDPLLHPSQDVAGNNRVSVLNYKATIQWLTSAFKVHPGALKSIAI